MISAAIGFFIIAVIATILSFTLGFTGIADVDINTAWILAVVIIFAFIFRVLGHSHQRKFPFL